MNSWPDHVVAVRPTLRILQTYQSFFIIFKGSHTLQILNAYAKEKKRQVKNNNRRGEQVTFSEIIRIASQTFAIVDDPPKEILGGRGKLQDNYGNYHD